jgi:hypothetical protein
MNITLRVKIAMANKQLKMVKMRAVENDYITRKNRDKTVKMKMIKQKERTDFVDQ